MFLFNNDSNINNIIMAPKKALILCYFFLLIDVSIILNDCISTQACWGPGLLGSKSYVVVFIVLFVFLLVCLLVFKGIGTVTVFFPGIAHFNTTIPYQYL